MVDTFSFSDDSALKCPADDKLGFKPFAERIAKALIAIDAPEGYVVGLHGVWGSGKSTALNFAVKEVERLDGQASEGKKTVVIRFEPWLVSGHQNLISAFFKVLAEKLPTLAPPKPSKWRQWLRASTELGGSPAIDATATLGSVLLDPTGGILGKAVGEFGKSTLQKRVAKWKEAPSLQSAYRTLATRLEEQSHKIIVVIDDVDRLTRDEIREMMQLVKSVGRLPNVVYLLAYDRRIVWAALKEPGNEDDGPCFAEKIIQHELELPRPQQKDLLRIFDAAASGPVAAMRADERFSLLVRAGLTNWLSTPRHAIRLANALVFTWSALKDEVDPQDLMIMEGLRLFEYETFQWVRAQRAFLVQPNARFSAADSKRIVDRLQERLDRKERSYLLDLLGELFPAKVAYFCRRGDPDRSAYASAVVRGGVGTALGYDTYFSLYPPDGELPRSTVDALVKRLDDVTALMDSIDSVLGQADRDGDPLVISLLDNLHCRFVVDDELMPTEALCQALFNKGGDILVLQEGMYAVWPPRLALAGLFHLMARRWGENRLANTMLNLIPHASPLISSFLLLQLAPSGDTDRNARELLTDDNAEMIERAVKGAINKARSAAVLHNVEVLWPVLKAWERWAPESEISEWIDDTLQNEPATLGKLPIFFQRFSEKGESWHFRSDAPAALFHRASLRDAAQKLVADTASPSALREKAHAVLDGLRQEEAAATDANKTEDA